MRMNKNTISDGCSTVVLDVDWAGIGWVGYGYLQMTTAMRSSLYPGMRHVNKKYTAVLYVWLCSGADCGSSLVGHWETDSLPKRHQLWRGFREGRILTCKALKGNIFFIYTCMMRHQQIISNLMFESRECKKRLNLWTNGEQNLPFCNRAAPKTSVT